MGKSSLINMLTNKKKLAKISATPGKTQTINHFMINQQWYLVDLPGYGYAKTSRDKRYAFGQMIEQYILQRENLNCLFILLDSRLEPQKNDLSFIQWCGEKEVPIVLVFTKADKLTKNQLNQNLAKYKKTLLTMWDELPSVFVTSSTEKRGQAELLTFIEGTLATQK